MRGTPEFVNKWKELKALASALQWSCKLELKAISYLTKRSYAVHSGSALHKTPYSTLYTTPNTKEVAAIQWLLCGGGGGGTTKHTKHVQSSNQFKMLSSQGEIRRRTKIKSRKRIKRVGRERKFTVLNKNSKLVWRIFWIQIFAVRNVGGSSAILLVPFSIEMLLQKPLQQKRLASKASRAFLHRQAG